MSTGKRLAKRSILGTRVACWLQDVNFYSPGVICDIKNADDGPVYTVKIQGESKIREVSENDLVGSGFTPVSSVKLRSDQKVFITYNQREVPATVVYHRPNIDEVLISVVNPETGSLVEVKKKLEEIRLLESRKSARLADQDQDFAKLADCASDRTVIRKSSNTIDVPSQMQTGYGSSRKRRSSSEEDLTDECAAALVLMKLSCSPRSPVLHEGLWPSESFSGSSSVSSGVWSLSGGPSSAQSGATGGLRSTTPSPPLSDSTPPPASADDGIDLDDIYEDNVSRKRRSSTRTMFKCTWTGCYDMATSSHDIEQHIRSKHLCRPVVQNEMDYDSDDDHEEEFYWTEVEIAVTTHVEPLDQFLTTSRVIVPASPQSPKPKDLNNCLVGSLPSAIKLPPLIRANPPSPYTALTFVSPPPTLSHMDMARPPHEDPDFAHRRTNSPSILSSSWPRSSYFGPGKIKARPTNSPKGGRGKRNGESRKCRKVYGMEQKDLWCTQCKWKKACSRFSE